MKKIIYSVVVFLFGFFIGNYNILIKQANASYCNCDYYDFQYEVENEIDSKIDSKISEFDFDFQSAVESIVEDCSVDSYGDISC
jgi:hypothetical protein